MVYVTDFHISDEGQLYISGFFGPPWDYGIAKWSGTNWVPLKLFDDAG